MKATDEILKAVVKLQNEFDGSNEDYRNLLEDISSECDSRIDRLDCDELNI